MKEITKAVIPVAGYGTRFLPYTKAVPKAMLPILNKPAVQIISEEVASSGIKEVLFVVGYKKEIIEAHFSRAEQLEEVLLGGNKKAFYDAIKVPENMFKVEFVEQKELNGTAGAIKVAKDFVGKDDFAILFGDDVMYNAKRPVIGQLIDRYKISGKSVIGCKEVSREDVTKYASVEYHGSENNVYFADRIIEKPKLEDVKSTLSPLGRYVVSNEIFDVIDTLKRSVNNEYQLTDALDILAKQDKLEAIIFDGTRYDMGSRLGYLKANVEYALRDDELKDDFLAYLKELVK